MAEVVIYSSMFCGYCARAKALLDRKGVAYEDIDVMAAPPGRRFSSTANMSAVATTSTPSTPPASSTP